MVRYRRNVIPADDADFSGRWRRIKGHFSSQLITSGVALRRNPNDS
jgi:REP-associated tyrosine transposase